MDAILAELAPIYAQSGRFRDVTLFHLKLREVTDQHLKMRDSWSKTEKVNCAFLEIKMANLKTVFLDRSGPPIGVDAIVSPADDAGKFLLLNGRNFS